MDAAEPEPEPIPSVDVDDALAAALAACLPAELAAEAAALLPANGVHLCYESGAALLQYKC